MKNRIKVLLALLMLCGFQRSRYVHRTVEI